MQTEPVSKQIQELEAIRRQKRMWSLGATILLAVTVIGCVLSLRDAVYGLTTPGPTQQAFQKDLSERVQKNEIPRIEEYGRQGITGVDYSGAAKKLNDRTPELVKASMEQMRLLSDDLTKRGNKVFDQTFNAAIKDRDKKVRAMFPEANEQQVNGVMANLTSEAQAQVAEVNDTLFAPHKKALDNIVSDLTPIQNAEGGSVKGEIPTWEMGLLIFDIAREDMKDLQPKSGDSKTSGQPKSGGKEKK